MKAKMILLSILTLVVLGAVASRPQPSEPAAAAMRPAESRGMTAFTIDREAVEWLWSLDGYPSDPLHAERPDIDVIFLPDNFGHVGRHAGFVRISGCRHGCH